eukprot:1782584-Prymnesium_polylepis.2
MAHSPEYGTHSLIWHVEVFDLGRGCCTRPAGLTQLTKDDKIGKASLTLSEFENEGEPYDITLALDTQVRRRRRGFGQGWGWVGKGVGVGVGS